MPHPLRGQRAAALCPLGARACRSPLPVTRAAEEAAGSTPTVVQAATSPSGEGDSSFRGETAAALQAPSTSLSLLAEKLTEQNYQLRELALRSGQLNEKLTDQNERFGRLESGLEKLAQQNGQVNVKLAQQSLELTEKLARQSLELNDKLAQQSRELNDKLAQQSREQAVQSGQLKDMLAQQSLEQSLKLSRLETSLVNFGSLITFLVAAVPVLMMFLQNK